MPLEWERKDTMKNLKSQKILSRLKIIGRRFSNDSKERINFLINDITKKETDFEYQVEVEHK